MKLRVIGTKEECETAKRYYDSLRKDPRTKSVEISKRYPSRGSAELFRVYIEVNYYDVPEERESGTTDETALDRRTIHNAHVSAIQRRSARI